MAVVNSWYNLSEEVPGLPFRDVPLVTDVVIQVPSAGVLHHNHNFVLIFKYWGEKNQPFFQNLFIQGFKFNSIIQMEMKYHRLFGILVWTVQSLL